jgi:uncharacterized protein GlcG (DUF336 family)
MFTVQRSTTKRGAMKVSVLAAVLAAVVVPNAFAQQAPPSIPSDLAVMMAQEAVLKCRADGFKVAAMVVDAANVEKAVLRDEGAGAIHIAFAQAKINSVLLTGRPSGSNPDGAPTIIKGSAPKQMAFGGMVGVDAATGRLIAGLDAAGAIPITVGNTVIGVIGVGGAPSPAKDLACANAGLAKVADKLK